MADEQQGVEALENIIAALQSNNTEIRNRCNDALPRIHRWTGMDGVRTLEVGRGSNRRGWSGLEFG